VLFFTGVLSDMPKAVLGAIVFLIGFDLIDIRGLQRIYRRRVSEFIIAAVTAIVVFAVGVEQGTTSPSPSPVQMPDSCAPSPDTACWTGSARTGDTAPSATRCRPSVLALPDARVNFRAGSINERAKSNLATS
jgi:hypothetical protein